MVKLLMNKEELKFTTTTFPDGTSQVWKIEGIPQEKGWQGFFEIQWIFENEAELMHVCQLAQLVRAEVSDVTTLLVPYLPYGRQDKSIANGLSFALTTFKTILRSCGISSINTYDAHSTTDGVGSISAEAFHKHILDLGDYAIICFPDAGANERYKYNFNIDIYTQVCFEKTRNQATGEITGLKLLGNSKGIAGNKVLIVDDICDGGMTFIKVAEALKEFNPKQIDLAVSHGLFSKGKQCLYDAGIKEIFTTNSLLRNPDGFKVW